ncbi:hypothetical protein Back11_22340 [Paenibacillus baekrokdamisoli]|uniref:Uncharacterized protein n=1 Tax=Paenibacillus baekrokdamisoli TaxID=1712516 RepID=A0A3G9JD54_9BACL|nr:DinB family protein [Paenibacillus baekrokdamisoli]MBB3069757.1 putative damage-inducible protein DinB [Paenibacillus baekrokdamisoli]BBH20889.1 hypothetical protein Back11_22340 [Paenibacillus baekrokdamisoli]
MKPISEQMNKFQSLIPFLESLRSISQEQWTTPIKTGKWSTRDIVAHLLLWDRYFGTEAISKIAAGDPVTVKHLDFDAFNKNALDYALTIGHNELIDQAIAERELIIRQIEQFSDKVVIHEYIDGDGNVFCISNYLVDFADHDSHHRGQIELFMKEF